METIRIHERGEPESPVGDPLAPGALSALQMLNPNLTDVTAPETDRRLALANWITHEDNPLTYRVIANRLWQWTFGNGLVTTPSDFGFGGSRPSHRTPRLAGPSFKTNNGSLKALIREIVLSKTYRSNHFSDQNLGVGKDRPTVSSGGKTRDEWMRKPFAIRSFVQRQAERQREVPDSRTLPTSMPMPPSIIRHGGQSKLWRQHLPLRCPHHPQPVHDHTRLPGSGQLHSQKAQHHYTASSLSLNNNDFMLARPATSPNGSKARPQS